MNKQALFSMALIGLMVFSPLSVSADPPGHAKGNKNANRQAVREAERNEWKSKNKVEEDTQGWVRPQGQARLDQSVFRQLMIGRGNGLDPATRSILQSQQPLPPGIRKNLLRGKPLPPGIAKKVYNLPPSAYASMGIPPNAYRIGSVGRNVILYDVASGIVRDILYNAF
jgi:hypothetical protein